MLRALTTRHHSRYVRRNACRNVKKISLSENKTSESEQIKALELRLQGPDVLSPTNRLRKELKIFLLTHLLWNAGDRSGHLQANYNESWMHCYTCLGQFVTMSQVHLSHQSGFKAFGSFSASYTHRL